MSVISSVALPQPFAPPPPSALTPRTTGSSQPNQSGGNTTAPTTLNGRVLNVTA